MSLPWLTTPWQRFLERAGQGLTAHALLVSGPVGVGKLQLANEMLRWLLCLEPGKVACGSCRSCRLLEPSGAAAHPERFVLTFEDERRELTVPQARQLISQLSLTTTISPRKVALIHPADRLNRNASNALLKTLEEPPGNAVIILVSDDPARLPVTVRSRCQVIAVEQPDAALAREWLTGASGLEPGQAELALEAAGGSPRLALAMAGAGQLEQFTRLREVLLGLRGRPGFASAAAAALAELEQEPLWRWLSLSAAAALRGVLAGEDTAWTRDITAADAARLSRLQGNADLNQRLAESTVRQDLLLQEWLLEWGALYQAPAVHPRRAG